MQYYQSEVYQKRGFFAKKRVDTALTVDSDRVHGITKGVNFDFSPSDIVACFCERRGLFRLDLIIQTVYTVYRFRGLKDPRKAEKVLCAVMGDGESRRY